MQLKIERTTLVDSEYSTVIQKDGARDLVLPPLGSFVMVVTTPKSIRNSLDPSVYLAQDNSEIRYKLLMFSQEGAAGAARAANGSS